MTFIDPTDMKVISDTYESALYEAAMKDSNIFSADVKDFFYFLIQQEASVLLLVEITLVSMQ